MRFITALLILPFALTLSGCLFSAESFPAAPLKGSVPPDMYVASPNTLPGITSAAEVSIDFSYIATDAEPYLYIFPESPADPTAQRYDLNGPQSQETISTVDIVASCPVCFWAVGYDLGGGLVISSTSRPIVIDFESPEYVGNNVGNLTSPLDAKLTRLELEFTEPMDPTSVFNGLEITIDSSPPSVEALSAEDFSSEGNLVLIDLRGVGDGSLVDILSDNSALIQDVHGNSLGNTIPRISFPVSNPGVENCLPAGEGPDAFVRLINVSSKPHESLSRGFLGSELVRFESVAGLLSNDPVSEPLMPVIHYGLTTDPNVDPIANPSDPAIQWIFGSPGQDSEAFSESCAIYPRNDCVNLPPDISAGTWYPLIAIKGSNPDPNAIYSGDLVQVNNYSVLNTPITVDGPEVSPEFDLQVTSAPTEVYLHSPFEIELTVTHDAETAIFGFPNINIYMSHPSDGVKTLSYTVSDDYYQYDCPHSSGSRTATIEAQLSRNDISQFNDSWNLVIELDTFFDPIPSVVTITDVTLHDAAYTLDFTNSDLTVIEVGTFTGLQGDGTLELSFDVTNDGSQISPRMTIESLGLQSDPLDANSAWEMDPSCSPLQLPPLPPGEPTTVTLTLSSLTPSLSYPANTNVDLSLAQHVYLNIVDPYTVTPTLISTLTSTNKLMLSELPDVKLSVDPPTDPIGGVDREGQVDVYLTNLGSSALNWDSVTCGSFAVQAYAKDTGGTISTLPDIGYFDLGFSGSASDLGPNESLSIPFPLDMSSIVPGTYEIVIEFIPTGGLPILDTDFANNEVVAITSVILS